MAQFYDGAKVAQRLKRLPPIQETRVPSLGREDPLEEKMAAHPSILAWRSPWTEEPGGSDSKEFACQCGRPRFEPWVGNIPWRREWLPTPVFLPGAFHGQRSLVGYSPWGHKESDMTERLSTHTYEN